MQAKLDPVATQLRADIPELYPNAKSSPRSTIGSNLPRSEAAASSPNTYGGLLESNVTFRRDSYGQIYYVVTDAQSGKELREVPAEEIRKTGEGIAEYLKREESKSAVHVELNA